ncbi:uncharacterized protein [Miscanthus floridulus]|uniref:uncharacterized protein n=1 Tax=Miscanthus floridulus TaxID=154761 RepID=UPI00345A8671
MASKYINVPLNTSLKGWNARWFYMKQSHPAIRCDVDHIPESQKSWSEKSSSADMQQVREVLYLIKGVEINGELVAASFIVRRVQPCKERAHPGFDFKGDNDGTRESTGRLSSDDVLERAAELFALNASFSVSRQTRAVQIRLLRKERCTSRACREVIGRRQ